jgi:hypothetical protein
MRLRRLVVLLAIGAFALWARRRGSARECVTLAYEDGSAVTLEAGSPDAERLLPLARALLAPRS